MSATSGIRICFLISPSFSAASLTGTATRTMSQPAASSDQIWSSVASTSRVSVLVMDCTVIGASPPIMMEPSWICLVLRRGVIRWLLFEEAQEVDARQIIVDGEHHQEQQQEEPDLLGHFPLPKRELTAQDPLADEEEQVPTVQDRHGEQVQERQVDADHCGEESQAHEPLLGLLSGHHRDPEPPPPGGGRGAAGGPV